MIKNLVFDLGGVIVPLNRVACIRAFNEVVGYKDFGDVLRSYRQVGYFEKFETGRITAPQFRDIIRSRAVMTTADGQPRVVTDEQIDYSLNCFLCGIPQDRIDALLRFRKEYRMLLLSNTNPFIMDWACSERFPWGLPLDAYFDKMYFSYMAGFTKPDERIFKYMLGDSGIKPDETLFVEDGKANIDTAEKLGFRTYCPLNGEDWRMAVEANINE